MSARVRQRPPSARRSSCNGTLLLLSNTQSCNTVPLPGSITWPLSCTRSPVARSMQILVKFVVTQAGEALSF